MVIKCSNRLQKPVLPLGNSQFALGRLKLCRSVFLPQAGKSVMLCPGTLAISEPSWCSPSGCALEVLSCACCSDHLPGAQRGDFEIKGVAFLIVPEPAISWTAVFMSCTANVA